MTGFCNVFWRDIEKILKKSRTTNFSLFEGGLFEGAEEELLLLVVVVLLLLLLLLFRSRSGEAFASFIKRVWRFRIWVTLRVKSPHLAISSHFPPNF